MSSRKAAATKECVGSGMLPWCALLLGATCARTPLLPVCSVEITPTTLDFGEVAPGDQVARTVSVITRGNGACRISDLGTGPGSDPWFASGPQAAAPLVVNPGAQATVSVTFSPVGASLPLQRAATLILQTNDPERPRVEVSLTGRIHTNCTLTLSPPVVDFGHVPLDSTVARSVLVTNTGSGRCEIAGIAIGQGSDKQFVLSTGQVGGFSLAPGAGQSIAVAFHAADLATPHHRTGRLVFESSDAKQATVTVPLAADIDIGCSLSIVPDKMDFGKVVLNTSPNRAITLINDGSDTCQVSGVDFGPGTDPGFTVEAGQARAFAVAPGARQSITVRFGAFDSAPPHVRTGTLVLQTGNPRVPTASIPLSATIDTACVEASRWIYTVDSSGTFSRFDPTTLTFTDIGLLACPSFGKANSMAVDQNAVAWVAYDDGNLFKVDTGTGKCETTPFAVGQYDFVTFGMGFVFQPSTGVDTLYLASYDQFDPGWAELATVSFPSLVVTPIGPLTAGFAVELTGTGDGSLWGFVPATATPTAEGPAVLVRLDPANGATLDSYSYPTLPGGSAWAVKFWGGSFWIFLDGAVYEVPRTTPQTIRTAIAGTGRNIVGAGVSTCAPIF